MLGQGGVIAFCTETYYALGAAYDSPEGIGRIFALKRRPHEKAMPLIVGGTEAIDMVCAEVSPEARALMKKHWPGPLTLILKARPSLPEAITSGSKVALRVPGESFGLRLARAFGRPITSTSANARDNGFTSGHFVEP